MSSQKTSKLNLHKWVGTDYVLRTEFNDNFQTLDDKAGEVDQLIKQDRSQNRLLANYEAWFDVDSRATPNSGKYYDLFDGTNDLSIGQIDQTKTRSTTSLAASTSAVTITVESVTGLEAGQEVTIFDDVALERKIISSIDTTNSTITVPSLSNSYKQWANVVRSSVIVDTTNNLLKFDGWANDTTIDRTTPTTVVASTYRTTGNSGRKLVRLDDGTLISALKNGDNLYVRKSTDNGGNWSQIYSTTTTGFKDVALVSAGNKFGMLLYATKYVYFSLRDDTGKAFVNLDISDADDGTTDLCSITRDSSGYFHATWASKTGVYPNSFNVRYNKSTATDGSTWGTVEQLTTDNTSGIDNERPTIVNRGDGNPVIVYEWSNGTSDYEIRNMYFDGTSWSSVVKIYDGGTYNQGYSSSIFVPPSIDGTTNGTIHVSWHGYDSTYTNSTNIRYSNSTDGGITWSAMERLTSEDNSQYPPSITVDKNNKIYVFFDGVDGTISSYKNLRKVTNDGTGWTSVSTLTNNTSGNIQSPNTLYDSTFSLDFTDALTIYEDDQAGDIKFRGKFIGTKSIPVQAVDVRYNISPSSSITEVVAWIERQIGDLTIDGAVSIVDSTADENYTTMDKSTVNIDSDTDEDQFVGSVSTAAGKVTLRLTLSRTDTTISKAVEKILGAVN